MRPQFPKWMNALPTVILFAAMGGFATIVAVVWYYFTPKFWEVGYMPRQPVAFSHQIHAGKLGMDCRYCHSQIEKSPHANVPSVSTCMGCHTVVDDKSGYLKKATTIDGGASAHWVSKDLQTLRAAYAQGAAPPWRRIHKLPDYAHFQHAAHINAGVSCFSCHNRIDEMPVVHQVESLSMSWCLDCHRAPEKHLVGKEFVTNLRAAERMLAEPNHAKELGARLAAQLRSRMPFGPPQNCGACHY